MNLMIKKEVDKFKNKTTVSLDKEFKLRRGALGAVVDRAQLNLRYLSMPDGDGLYIDCNYHSKLGFQNMDGGGMVIRLNDCENITLDFLLSKSKRDLSQSNNSTLYHEYNFVKIDKSILQKICDARTIEIQVSGEYLKEYTIDDCKGFINYCQLFYEGLYKESRYKVTVLDEAYQKEIDKKRIKVGKIVSIIVVSVCLLLLIYIMMLGIDQ